VNTTIVLDAVLASFTPTLLLLNIGGVAVGIFFGALPGIGAVLTLSVFLGVTFGMSPVAGLVFLGALYSGCVYGGSIPAILINTPGTAASAATTFDGYPLAQAGKAKVALGASLMSSFIGGVIGWVGLTTLGPLLGNWALQFGPPEYCALAILALTTISSLARAGMVKGLVAATLGLLLGTAGHDLVTGVIRYDFGLTYLEDGLPLVPVLIGLFAIPEAFIIAGTGGAVSKLERMEGSLREGFRLTFLHYVTLLRSSAIGAVIGILPGIGGAIANVVAYAETVRVAKDAGSFGKGNIEGVIAPESANNATVASSLVPTLVLGIPGSDVAAVFLGGLIVHGIVPGPELFTSESLVTYTFIASLLISQFLLFTIGSVAAPTYARLTMVPSERLVPLILVLALSGAFAYQNNMNDVVTCIVFGALGYAFRQFGYSRPAFILGFILSHLIEQNFNRAMIISNDSPMIFFTEPISLVIVILIVVSLLYPFIKKWFGSDPGRVNR
jgi:putative tricarboxylic transport membrane protein